jgi:hypothetical protein
MTKILQFALSKCHSDLTPLVSFDLRTLHHRLLIAAASTTPQPLRSIRVADVHC